ncbi:MAG: SRPBCC family protein [Planctomycetota bacterium]
MAKMTLTETIDAPRAAVFARSTNIDGWADDISGITRIERVTEGPFGVGTRFKETRVMMGKEATEEFEVTEVVQDEHYTMAAESCGTKYLSTFRFADAPGGGTAVTLEFEGTPQTMIAKVMGAAMGPMMKKMMRKAIAQDMADLKAACERAG